MILSPMTFRWQRHQTRNNSGKHDSVTHDLQVAKAPDQKGKHDSVTHDFQVAKAKDQISQAGPCHMPSHFRWQRHQWWPSGKRITSWWRDQNHVISLISGGKGTSISFLSHLIWSGSLSDIPSILDENTTLHICMGFDVNFTRHFHTSPLSNWLPFGSDMGGTWIVYISFRYTITYD